MTDKDTLEPKGQELQAHVFYVGRGSAVAVRLGEPGCGKYGVVDCYRGNAVAQGSMLDFLCSEAVRSVEFLLLTHPHQDHFLGVSEILSECGGKIKQILDWGIDFKAVATGLYSRDFGPDVRAAEELRALHQFVLEERCRYTAITTPGVLFYHDEDRGITGKAVAPRSRSFRLVSEALSEYFKDCKDAFKRGAQLPTPKRMPDPNLLSSAVLLKSRSCQLLLGGDVLKAEWDALLADGEIPSETILLSHHGSHTGFPSSKWASGFGRENSVALVSGQGNHQPSRSVVRAISRVGGRVYSTSSAFRRPSLSQLGHYVEQHHHSRSPPVVAPQHLVVSMGGAGTAVKAEPLGGS